MEYRRLGRSGLAVSEVSLGSWLTFGSSVEVEATREIVHRAYDLGVNFFDTADVYANGQAEEALGRALRGLPRTSVVIATKCFFPTSERPNERGLSRKHVTESVHASLRRLGCDYLDLHQCHRPDPTTPIEETLRAYEDLIRQGVLLYWGVSEWRAADIVDACRSAEAWRAYRPISNQPQYSLLRRGIEREVLPVCVREGLGQLIFSPLAQGVLSGKYAAGSPPPAGTRGADDFRNQFMRDFLRPETLARVEALRPLAADLGVTLAQLALAWCLRQPGVSSVIVGATRAAQLEENAKASGLRLPAELAERIDEILPAPGA
jgi:voltage-dependent potassium channel beta subunit